MFKRWSISYSKVLMCHLREDGNVQSELKVSSYDSYDAATMKCLAIDVANSPCFSGLTCNVATLQQIPAMDIFMLSILTMSQVLGQYINMYMYGMFCAELRASSEHLWLHAAAGTYHHCIQRTPEHITACTSLLSVLRTTAPLTNLHINISLLYTFLISTH